VISFAIQPGGKSWRKTLVGLCLCLWMSGAFLPCHLAAAASTTSSNRFLFIVDTSSLMKKWDEPARDAMFDLIYSGVRGYMTNGDSYGVWLAAETNNTSGSVEVWRHKFATELASRTALKVKDAGTRGKPALDIAIADAKRVARAVGDVTVILVSNGETPLKGTPFDGEINAAIAEVKPAMKAAKATINTALVARDGEFLAWAINSPEYLIAIPVLPPREETATEVAKTAPEAEAPAPAPTPPPVAKPAPPPVRMAAKPIVITRDTVDRDKEAMRALASTVEGARPASAVVTAAVNTVAAPAPVAAPATAVAPVPPPAVAQSIAPTTATTSTNIQTVSPSAATPPPPAETSEPVVESKEPAKAVVQVVPKAAPEATSESLVWWIVGAGMAVLLGVGMIVLLRRNRPPAQSLVSEAIALERMYKPRS
jgi:hypothetical protein